MQLYNYIAIASYINFFSMQPLLLFVIKRMYNNVKLQLQAIAIICCFTRHLTICRKLFTLTHCSSRYNNQNSIHINQIFSSYIFSSNYYSVVLKSELIIIKNQRCNPLVSQHFLITIVSCGYSFKIICLSRLKPLSVLEQRWVSGYYFYFIIDQPATP